MNVVFDKLVKFYENNDISHAYLIETNNIDSCYKDLLNLIKRINCPTNYSNNCQNCNICNLIDQKSLPSLIVIEPDGINIKKEQVLELKKKFSAMPLFTKENIYVIKMADKLNSSSANTMLKFIEEPNDHIIGFFMTSNINNVIPTIRSRCEVLTINYNNDEVAFNEEYCSVAKEYIYKTEVEKKDKIMYNKSVILDKYTQREDIVEIFKIIMNIYQNIFYNIYFPGNEFFEFLKAKNILRRIKLQTEILKSLSMNVNIELLLDKYIIELSDEND